MEQFFEVVVRENNSGALVFNVTTTDIEKLDIDNLNAGLSYIATGILFLIIYVGKCQSLGRRRMLCDRVRKSKICFEITAFLNYERGISRAGEFKTSNVNNKKNCYCFHLMF